MNNQHFSIVFFVSVIKLVHLLPFGQYDPNAPKNPFSRSHVPFQAPQQDSPISHSSSFQQNSANNAPSAFQPVFNDDASNWPTPPPIGGLPSSNQNVQQPSGNNGNSLVTPPNMPSANNPGNSHPQSTSNQASELVLPPPIPGIDSNAQGQNNFATNPSKFKPANGNPFDNLQVKNSFQQQTQFQNGVQSNNNPFDSLPVRSPSVIRQKRQSPILTPGTHLLAGQGFPMSGNHALGNPMANPALPNPMGNPADLPLHNPIMPDPSVSAFPNTNGKLVLAPTSSLQDTQEQKTFLPNQLANQGSLIRNPNTPINENKIFLPNQMAEMQKAGMAPNQNPMNSLPSQNSMSKLPNNQNPMPNVPQSNPNSPMSNPQQSNPAPRPKHQPKPNQQHKPHGKPGPMSPNEQSPPGQPPVNQPQMTSPVQQMQPWQNPNKIPPALQNNPALPPVMQNPINPPLQNAPLANPDFSSFPNTNGKMVLAPSSNFPDAGGEQKVFLPSQMANPQNLIMNPAAPPMEPKQLLPSQIATMQEFAGTG